MDCRLFTMTDFYLEVIALALGGCWVQCHCSWAEFLLEKPRVYTITTLKVLEIPLGHLQMVSSSEELSSPERAE